MEPIQIEYKFIFGRGDRKAFRLAMHPATLNLIRESMEEPPDWAELSFQICPHCTLSETADPYCPLALGLSAVMNPFTGKQSFDKVVVVVKTGGRKVVLNSTVQRGLSSLMGLVIAASGCPHTAFLKPMARFHLPMASDVETVYRATSMYLLAQYFRLKQGLAPDLALAGLTERYRNLELVNIHVAKRLRAGAKADSMVNAVIILDTYAKILPYSIDESLKELGFLFSDYTSRDE
ncbi:MAG: hypothetical protein AB1921_16440 [Thermodesulfobacteriota bacterium]